MYGVWTCASQKAPGKHMIKRTQEMAPYAFLNLLSDAQVASTVTSWRGQHDESQWTTFAVVVSSKLIRKTRLFYGSVCNRQNGDCTIRLPRRLVDSGLTRPNSEGFGGS